MIRYMGLVPPTWTSLDRPQQNPIDLAVRDCELAAADFVLAILDASTVDQALTLHRRIEAVLAILIAVSSSALEKADSF